MTESADVEESVGGRPSVTFAESPLAGGEADRRSSAARVAATPLLQSMTEVMALSYLVFMYADLRALSSTGRIATRFDHIAVESDYSPRYESDFVAGDRPSGTGRASRGGKDGGLSTAQIMAVMLLEIDSTTRAKREAEEGGRGEDSQRGQPDTWDRRFDRRSMTKLLQVYASIIGADLKNNIGRIKVSESVRDLASGETRGEAQAPSAPPKRFALSAAVEMIMRQNRHGGGGDTGGNGGVEAAAAESGEENTANEAGDVVSQASAESESSSRPTAPPRPLTRTRSMLVRRRSELMRLVNGQDAAIRLPRLDNAEEEVGRVAANIFSSAAAGVAAHGRAESALGSPNFADDVGLDSEKVKVSVTSDDMRRIMEHAVKSRIYSKLDFMANFFREGTVCQLMALSKARVVWFNDWFPAKELTYGICVDESKNQVIILFRGAITSKDWAKSMDYKFATATNPVEGGPDKVKLHSGFYSYLFRKRKDTGTTKYHQIAEVANRIGVENFRQDYNLMVCGHSLGAALSTVFSFWASADPRFTRNGPVRVFSFGSPYVGSHCFADSWRRQEEAGRLRYARFFNHNDFVTYGPSANIVPTGRGSRYRHVGLSVAIRPVRRYCKGLRSDHEPNLFYIPKEKPVKSYCRGLRNTWALHLGIPWEIKMRHTLQELIRRVADGKCEEERMGSNKKGIGFDLMNKSLDELYREKADIKTLG